MPQQARGEAPAGSSGSAASSTAPGGEAKAAERPPLAKEWVTEESELTAQFDELSITGDHEADGLLAARRELGGQVGGGHDDKLKETFRQGIQYQKRKRKAATNAEELQAIDNAIEDLKGKIIEREQV